MRGKRKADEKHQALCAGLDRFENGIWFLPSDRGVKMHTEGDEKKNGVGSLPCAKTGMKGR